tara:strand:- start:575 stop:1174 length:600 start_codon:yes stop_codon:yes gene_type:complete
MTKISHILIAAGESKRIGNPKQLLDWGSVTLIENQIRTLLKTEENTYVVLGAYYNEIFNVIKKYPIKIFYHKNWKNGMGSSIAFGIKEILKKSKNYQGFLISLCDMPLIEVNYFKKLIQNFNINKNKIIVSKSKLGVIGVPAIFPKTLENELMKLNEDVGAKEIINKYKVSVNEILCDDLDDIDTLVSYKRLIKKIIPQ